MIALKMMIAIRIFNLPPAFNPLISLVFYCQNILKLWMLDLYMSFHSLPDNIINIQEPDLTVQEFLYCQFIRRVKYGRHGTALSGCLDCHRKSQEGLHIRFLKCDLSKFRKTSRSPARYLL